MIKTIESALSVITAQQSKLKEEMDEAGTKIAQMDAGIADLEAQPLSLEDYGLHVKRLIELRASRHMDMLEYNFFQSADGLGRSPQNSLSMAALNQQEQHGMFPPFMFGGGDGVSLDALCAFCGEQIYESFMTRAREAFAARWGNESVTPVVTRQKFIAELREKRETLSRQREELLGKMGEIAQALAGSQS